MDSESEVWIVAGVLGVCLGIVVAILSVIFLSGYFLFGAQCNARAKLMGIESSYGLLQGCMVKIDGRWGDLFSYRTVRHAP